MSELITIKDKQFKPFIPVSKINEAVTRIGKQLNNDLSSECPVFLVVLNGSFMFAADLLREVKIPCEISFVKMASYRGTQSTGNVQEIIGIKENLENKTVVIVEDIVDSGNTMEKMLQILLEKKVKQIKIATALFKPGSFNKNFKIDYIGMTIGNDFVVGYGLDYDGMGRNLKEIYILA